MMLNVLQSISNENFLTNGYSYLWKLSFIRLDVVSDLIIILSYFAISLLLFYFLRQRPDIPFQKIFWLFCACIMTCGTTHLLELWPLWLPDYGLSSCFNAIAAGVPLYMAWELAHLIPKALGLPNLLELEKANQALHQAKSQLEIRVEARTQELKQAIAQLQSEIKERQQVEASLTEREQQYRSVVENVKEVIFQTDVKGYWTFLNPAWSQITGFAIADTIGTHLLDNVHPGDKQRTLKQFHRLIEGKKEYFRHELRYLTADGGYRWIEVFAQSAFDADGTMTSTCGTLYDITEHHLGEAALAERQRYLAALVEVQRRLLAFERDSQHEFLKQNPYNEILEILGQVSGASRVYVFENHRDDQNRLLMSLNAEWCALGIRSKIDNPVLQNLPYEDFFPRWAQLLSENEIIAGVVAEFPESERVVLELQGILSILILPLTVNGMFFGFIGFDNCTESLPWQASEVDLLSSAAAAVSLWKESVLAQQALRQSEATNRALLEAIPDALLRIRRDGTCLDFIPAKNSPAPISARKLLGKTISEVLPSELALKVSADVEAAFSTGKAQVSEVPIQIRADLHHYEIRTVFYSDDEVLTIGRDVTEQKQAEAALRESEERFRSLVAHIPGVVYRFAYDADRTAEFISDVIEEISGYPAADFLHNQVRTFASVVAPEDRAKVERIVSKRVALHKPYVLEYRMVRADGDVRWVYEKGQGVFTADGSLLCLDGVIFDITEYKQTQEELRLREEQFRQLTENINEVFFLTAPDLSKMLYVSPAYEDLWGRSTESLYTQPKTWLDSVHLEDRDRIVRTLTRHLQNVQDFQEEYRVVRPDGSIRWVWVRAFHILNQAGASERIAGIAEDVTERKLAEVEILNALAKEKELGDMKSRFISITSHEFRTPLATIMSTAELLEYYEWTKAEEVEQLHLIQDAVKHMLQLLDDLLFIGTAEAGKVRFNPEPLLLNEFCQELVAEIGRGMSLNPTDSDMQHTLTFACRGERFLACMDRKLLRQLLSNLLLNAIKYSPVGGEVLFELTCQDDKAIFEIQDRGIGIPREDQPRLFEFFYRAKNVGAIAGTGLGLAIVKTCVDLHRGEIAVFSDVGLGTRFTVSLPLKNYFSPPMLDSLPPHTKKRMLSC